MFLFRLWQYYFALLSFFWCVVLLFDLCDFIEALKSFYLITKISLLLFIHSYYKICFFLSLMKKFFKFSNFLKHNRNSKREKVAFNFVAFSLIALLWSRKLCFWSFCVSLLFLERWNDGTKRAMKSVKFTRCVCNFISKLHFLKFSLNASITSFLSCDNFVV